MNIGAVSQVTRLPPKTIRYYEEIGLVVAERDPNGYRVYSEPDARKLAFVARARALGFSIDDCRSLLSLYEDRCRESAEVRSIASDHLSRIEQKLNELEGMRATLEELVNACAGDSRPDCPILRDLAGDQE